MKCAVYRVDNGAVFVADATVQPNSDGSVSLLLPQGGYAGQEPGQYGVRHDGPNTQQYQRATLSGSTLVFVPLDNFAPCVYMIGQGKVYPA